MRRTAPRYTGRVAARGGGTVEVTDTALLLINGSVVAEPDIYEQTPRYENGVQYPLTLTDGEYFIALRCPRGCDSRWFGPVRTGGIRGTASSPCCAAADMTRPPHILERGRLTYERKAFCGFSRRPLLAGALSTTALAADRLTHRRCQRHL